MIWRPILAGVTTLRELETYYDINDVWDANEALDIQQEAERRALESMRQSQRV